MEIERFEWNGQLFALILRKNYEPEGVNFITDRDNPIQLGILKHKEGTKIKPHIHRNLTRTTEMVQEVLHIERGRVEVEFYNSSGKKVGDTILSCGDTILLISGGHGFNILEDTKMIEVKQGPYQGVEEDKEYLEIRQ